MCNLKALSRFTNVFIAAFIPWNYCIVRVLHAAHSEFFLFVCPHTHARTHTRECIRIHLHTYTYAYAGMYNIYIIYTIYKYKLFAYSLKMSGTRGKK